ncbi:MAG: hypothetical protein WC390_08530 [Sulfurimonas sp.]|jgi:hypothetical protein
MNEADKERVRKDLRADFLSLMKAEQKRLRFKYAMHSIIILYKPEELAKRIEDALETGNWDVID